MQHGATSKLFTGDIQYSSTDAAELVTITNSLQYSGLTDCDYIEATNFTARPGDELREDDLIQITVDGKTYRYEVYRACNPSTERTGRIYIKQRLLVGFNSNTVTRIRAKVTNAGKSTLILPLANSKIAGTIASDDDKRNPTVKNDLRKSFDEANLEAEIEVYDTMKHGWCVSDSSMCYFSQG